MNTQDTLLAYGEWLDSQGISGPNFDDSKSWDALAQQFIEEWESDETRATLAGRPTSGGRELWDARRKTDERVHRDDDPQTEYEEKAWSEQVPSADLGVEL